MLRHFINPKVLCILVVLFTGTGLLAQNGFREEFIEPPIENPSPSSLDEILGFDNLKIFFVSGILNLNFTNNSYGEVVIQIFDMSGKEIVKKKEEKRNSQFSFQHDSSALPKSLYIVRLTLDKSQTSRKVYL